MTQYKLDHITKIEGHAALNVKVEDGKVVKAEMNVFEGSRYFESIVLGRHYTEISELTGRICGICSPAHRIASLMAVEDAISVKPSEQTIVLRELLVNGAMIESHALHALLVSLVDYLGFTDPIQMMGKRPDIVKKALEIKRVGNKIVEVIGGRPIQPISPTVGGFKKLPSKDDLKFLEKELEKIRPIILEFLELFKKLKYPEYWREADHYSITSDTYSMVRGNPKGFRGNSFNSRDFEKNVIEEVRPYSSAKFSKIKGETYMVGALARINNNATKLSKTAKQYLFPLPNFNPFYNDYAQVIELMHLADDSLNIVRGLEVSSEKPSHDFKAGTGYSSTEAPRGTLYHAYEFNKDGRVVRANILTPTAQNLPNMEEDVKAYLPQVIPQGEKAVLWNMERIIRAYDPCISCSTHFLELKINDKRVG